MKLIVGLGNPGRKYEGTRHNVGFEVLDRLARGAAASKKFDGEFVQINLAGSAVLLLWPHTFMNLSGASVRKAVDFYKVANEDVLTICDDFNLPLAKLRFRPTGSAGGQKGLADILKQLGTKDIARLRVGVGPVPEGWDPAGFVLGKFSKPERKVLDEAIDKAVAGAELWSEQGMAVCMNRYNGN